MVVRKVKQYVEVSDEHLYMWLPANKNGFKVFRENGGNPKYAELFGVKLAVKVKAKE